MLQLADNLRKSECDNDRGQQVSEEQQRAPYAPRQIDEELQTRTGSHEQAATAPNLTRPPAILSGSWTNLCQP